MSNSSNLIKAIVKGTTEISEDAYLDKYLLSRGINPRYATRDQKVAHSKTLAFISWKNNRMNESVDKKDTVTMDIPLLIRVMELAREGIKSDMDLHRVVEKLINIRNKGMLTMKDYNYVAKIHEEIMPQISEEVLEEAFKQLDEISTTGYYQAAAKDRINQVSKYISGDKSAKTKIDARNRGMKRVEKRTHAEIQKANSGPQQHRPTQHTPSPAELRGYGQGRYMGDSVEHDEAIIEAKSAAVRWQQALQKTKKDREEQQRKDAESKARAQELLNRKPPVNEADCGCSDIPPEDKNKKLIQMSKSARIIKSIYKRKGMKEDVYDWEKDDKSTSSYGKKPKISTTKPTDNVGENKPDAAAVLKGGTTLTGQTRDTIEIDPMMKKRPGSDPTGKNK